LADGREKLLFVDIWAKTSIRALFAAFRGRTSS